MYHDLIWSTGRQSIDASGGTGDHYLFSHVGHSIPRDLHNCVRRANASDHVLLMLADVLNVLILLTFSDEKGWVCEGLNK